jgi:hypothetical protein
MFTDNKDYYDLSNPYSKLWINVDKKDLPTKINKILKYELDDFKKEFYANTQNCKKLVKSFLNGNVYVLKNCLRQEEINNMIENVSKVWKKEKFQFHKILDGVPNYSRRVDEKNNSKYSLRFDRYSSYFFPFNESKEKTKVFNYINRTLRLIKYISGYDEKIWEKNIPSDGVVDRVQICCYPDKTGGMELHQDPIAVQKFFISAYLSKKGINYEEGGIYCLNKKDEKIDLEQNINAGDFTLGLASLMHGVDKIKTTNSNTVLGDFPGRWWLGIYSVQTDYLKKRATTAPVKDKNLKKINSF